MNFTVTRFREKIKGNFTPRCSVAETAWQAD